MVITGGESNGTLSSDIWVFGFCKSTLNVIIKNVFFFRKYYICKNKQENNNTNI